MHTSRDPCQRRKCGAERVDECITAPETKCASHQGFGTLKLNAHHVSGSGWRRVSAIRDSGSAECVAPESLAKNVPSVETEATCYTADGGVIKNKGEMTVTMCSETGDTRSPM